MRLYDDPVEVRRGETEGPDQFLWRGRLWKVRAVVAHWVETGPWWQAAGRAAGASGADAAAPVDLVAERELWRVEAGRGAAARLRPVDGPTAAGPEGSERPEGPEGEETYGVFDLSFDWADGRWQLVGCLD